MRDASATNSGLSFLPGFLMSTVTGFAIGIITTKTGYVLPFYQTGFAIIALGMGLDSLWRASMPYSQQAVLLGVVGMGFGFIFVTSMMIVQASVPPKEIGPGTTSISFIQTMGGIIGLSIFNVVLMTSTGTVLEPKLAEVGAQFGIPASVTASMAAGVLGGPISTTLAAYAAYIPAGSAAYEAVVNVIQDSVGHAFSVVFLAIGCINVLPFISSLFLRKPNLSGGSIAQLEGKKKEGAVEEGAEAEAGAKDAAKGDVEDEAATMAVAGH